MITKSFIRKILILSIILIPFFIYGQDSTKVTEEFNKKIEIVLNKVSDGGESGIKSRHIYVSIEEKDFNLDNLKQFFSEYKKLYPEPYILTISVYSSKEMLQRLINFEKQPITIEFTKDEKGKEAARKFYERYYPLPQGYFRAEYNRYGPFEFFDYSPKKESPDMVRISLKTQNEKDALTKPVNIHLRYNRQSDMVK